MRSGNALESYGTTVMHSIQLQHRSMDILRALRCAGKSGITHTLSIALLIEADSDPGITAK